MNNLSNSMDAYNRHLDSIGTEISYSATSENGIKKSVSTRNNIGSTQNNQSGGFLNFLFGDEDASLKQKGSILTEMIIQSIENKEYAYADVLMNKPFIPDLSIVNKQGQNLIHVLINSKDRLKNAKESLIQMIANKANKDALNKQDINGKTPFFDAVKNGLHDLAEHMENHGAERAFQGQDFSIETDKNPEESGIYESMGNREPVPFSERSIFSKPRFAPTNVVNNDSIARIVRAFKTKSDDGSESIRDITRTVQDQYPDNFVRSLKTRFPSQSFTNTNASPVTYQPSVTKQPFNPLQRSPPKDADPITDIDSDAFINLLVKKIADEHDEKIDLSPTSEMPPSKVLIDDSDMFVQDLAEKLAGRQTKVSPSKDNSLHPNDHDILMRGDEDEDGIMAGGARKKKSSANHKAITTKTSVKPKNNPKKVVGTRKMMGFSEFDGESDMFGGMSENEMRNISRAATNQKNQFHEETVEKILSHLSDKDRMIAKAVKAIIYDEIKQSKKELSGLDKAAEMLKMVTKKKVDEVLKQKDLINKIVSYLKDKSASTSSNDSEPKKTNLKRNQKNIDFESSVELTSDYTTSDSSIQMRGGGKNKNRESELFDF
jgi:hypothetical protein